MNARKSLVVLISGRGSNLQALIEASKYPNASFTVAAVVSNRTGAAGLGMARAHGISVEALAAEPAQSREGYDRQLADLVDSHAPFVVALAGFMRILSAEFLQRFRGRLLNIHPSLLPQFVGLRTHRRALEARATRHGATVHFVTEDLDAGPAVVQAALDLRPDENEDSLAARVLALEHEIFPAAVQWYCDGRLQWRDGRAWFDGRELDEPIQWQSGESV